MQIQIAELTSRVFAISKLSSLESNFFGGVTALIYIYMYICFLTVLPSAFCDEHPQCRAQRVVHTLERANDPSRMGTAFLLSFQLLEHLRAG